MAATEELEKLLKNLANELDNVSHVLNPDKPTPLYGDISDFFARQKADAKLPSSFETHLFMGEISKNSRNASLDVLNLSAEFLNTGKDPVQGIRQYFDKPDTNLEKFNSGYLDLLQRLPKSKGISSKELDPHKRASFSLANTRKLLDLLEGQVKEAVGLDSAGSQSFSPSQKAPGPEKKAGSDAGQPVKVIKYDDALAKYLQRVYTLAEFIISLNLPQGVRKKYIDVEIYESQYSFIRKDEFFESELKKNAKQYVVAENGPFPFISLAVFVKEFANIILLTTLAFNERKISPVFFDRYSVLKQTTKDLMERILDLPKTDMKGSLALGFLRKEIVPVVNAWIKEVTNQIVAGRYKYYEEIAILAQGLVNRVNKIYKLESL